MKIKTTSKDQQYISLRKFTEMVINIKAIDEDNFNAAYKNVQRLHNAYSKLFGFEGGIPVKKAEGYAETIKEAIYNADIKKALDIQARIKDLNCVTDEEEKRIESYIKKSIKESDGDKHEER